MSAEYGFGLRKLIENTIDEWMRRRGGSVKSGTAYGRLILDKYGLPVQGGGEPVLFSFAANGTQGFVADYGATYLAVAGGSGGGTFAITVAGVTATTPDTIPFVVLAGNTVLVTLSGSSASTSAPRLLTLTQVL